MNAIFPVLILIKVSNDGTRKSSAKAQVTAREMSGDRWKRPLQETRKRHNFSLDFKKTQWTRRPNGQKKLFSDF